MKEQLEDRPANRGYLDTLDHQAFRLKRLLEDLIEASKASTGNLKASLELWVLHQVLGEYGEKLVSVRLDLRIRLPKEPVYVLADTRHLQRVPDNLLTNIPKYAQPGTGPV